MGTALATLAELFTSHFRGKRDLCFTHVNKCNLDARMKSETLAPKFGYAVY